MPTYIDSDITSDRLTISVSGQTILKPFSALTETVVLWLEHRKYQIGPQHAVCMVLWLGHRKYGTGLQHQCFYDSGIERAGLDCNVQNSMVRAQKLQDQAAVSGSLIWSQRAQGRTAVLAQSVQTEVFIPSYSVFYILPTHRFTLARSVISMNNFPVV